MSYMVTLPYYKKLILKKKLSRSIFVAFAYRASLDYENDFQYFKRDDTYMTSIKIV